MSHRCPGPQCLTVVGAEMLMCREHWRLVPALLRDDVWRAWTALQADLNDTTVTWHTRACENAISAIGGDPNLFFPVRSRRAR